MFSKKVEEHDMVKMEVGVKEKEKVALEVSKNDLIDFKGKYLRECA
jgi:hypothetical protein